MKLATTFGTFNSRLVYPADIVSRGWICYCIFSNQPTTCTVLEEGRDEISSNIRQRYVNFIVQYFNKERAEVLKEIPR